MISTIAAADRIAACAASGTVGDTMSATTKKPGGAHTATAATPLSQKAVSDMTSEEKFWVMAYARDKGNYERAGMSVPFANVDEYMHWRVMSAEAQAMGMSSQMMEDMANTAEQEQGRFMGDSGGLGGGSGGRLGGKGPAIAAAGGGGKWWAPWTWKEARQAAEAAVKAAKTAAAKRAVDLSAAAKQGQLGIKTIKGKSALYMYDKEIAGVVNIHGEKQIVWLDAKYATVDNANAAMAASLRDVGKKAPATEIWFNFGGDFAAAKKFQDELLHAPLAGFAPVGAYRGPSGSLKIGGFAFGREEDRFSRDYQVFMEFTRDGH